MTCFASIWQSVQKFFPWNLSTQYHARKDINHFSGWIGQHSCRSRTAVAPLERLKILMQVQGNSRVYTGVWQGLKHMAQTEGFRGMMKGNWTNCVRIIPNSAVKFLTYEQLSRWNSLLIFCFLDLLLSSCTRLVVRTSHCSVSGLFTLLSILERSWHNAMQGCTPSACYSIGERVCKTL